MRIVLLVLLYVLSSSAARTQTPGRVAINGTVVDTTGAALPGATVLLLNPTDSAMVSYARSGERGFFEIRNVRPGAYLFKVAYVGFFSYQKWIEPGEAAVLDAGTITLKPIAKQLFEVVVRTAKAPMTIKGDTIEYNTSSFKVPPGSTVEDLLRRLPGVLVDPDGTIKAQGQDVKRVTVDGKSFFGTDPKLATRNLAADDHATDKTPHSPFKGPDCFQRSSTSEARRSSQRGRCVRTTIRFGVSSEEINCSAQAVLSSLIGPDSPIRRGSCLLLIGTALHCGRSPPR